MIDTLFKEGLLDRKLRTVHGWEVFLYSRKRQTLEDRRSRIFPKLPSRLKRIKYKPVCFRVSSALKNGLVNSGRNFPTLTAFCYGTLSLRFFVDSALRNIYILGNAVLEIFIGFRNSSKRKR